MQTRPSRAARREKNSPNHKTAQTIIMAAGVAMIVSSIAMLFNSISIAFLDATVTSVVSIVILVFGVSLTAIGFETYRRGIISTSS